MQEQATNGGDGDGPLLGELRQLHLAINQTLARIKADVPKASVSWVA